MHVLDYADHFIQQLVRTHDPGQPMQIELHPGLHCDRYQCPHCFGHGQRPLASRLLAADEIAAALDEASHCNPLIVMSGVTTEPLTHPQAARIIDAIRSRNLRLGLYTKGVRSDAACAEALLQGDAECFVTFSLNAFNARDYQALHAIRSAGAGRGEGTAGEAYFDRVCANIAAPYDEKRRRGHHTQLRIAILLFRETIGDDLEAKLRPLTQMSDLVRLAAAQDRNDGRRVDNLPEQREALLHGLAERFRGDPKIRVLADTAVPVRATSFTRCHTQRFQVTIGKSGYLYHCPQVAVVPNGHLTYGNLRSGSLVGLLRSFERRQLFDRDVTTSMRCRICDRKDEAINRALGRADPPDAAHAPGAGAATRCMPDPGSDPRLAWGIIGTGRIARQFARALPRTRHGRLAAVSSRSTSPPGPEFSGARLHHGADALLADPEVQAVYIATPHPTHAALTRRAAAAGKHILCEKPIAMDAVEASGAIEAARRHDVLLMEAFMYRVHPQTAKLVALLRSGAIGEPRLIQASFGYHKPFDASSRYFDAGLGGSGILDVGGYSASMARLVAGVAHDLPFPDPQTVQAAARIGTSLVDEVSVATLGFRGGILAQLSVSVSLAQENVVRITGTERQLELASRWFCSGRQGGRSSLTLRDLRRPDGDVEEVVVEAGDWLYAIEADAAAAAIGRREAAWPGMTTVDSLGNMRTLDIWRAAAGVPTARDPEAAA